MIIEKVKENTALFLGSSSKKKKRAKKGLKVTKIRIFSKSVKKAMQNSFFFQGQHSWGIRAANPPKT